MGWPALALLTLSCISAFEIAHAAAETSIVRGAESEDDFACGGPVAGRPFTRFAYVMMHYEGTAKDPEYVLGTRVLIKSLLASKTSQDLVVLASTSVSRKTIRTFCDDGAIVQVILRLCSMLL